MFREKENKVLTFIPSYELKRMKLKYRVSKDPKDLKKIQKETELVEEEINSTIESYQRAREEFQTICDNFLGHNKKQIEESSVEWNLKELIFS